METTATPEIKKEVITLDKVNVRNLPELQGWKQKQKQVVKNHPFVAIKDNKTYEEAKKHRTALVSARTDIQKQDKLIASKLKELRSESKKVADELIQITQPHEDKQQDEVKRYEDKKEAERKERERIERERKEAIQNKINSVYAYWKTKISQLEFENISEFEKSLENGISKQDSEEMEEFEMDWAEKKNLLKNQLEERIKYITEQEEARKERERLAEERRKFEEEKQKEEEARKAREKKLKERNAKLKPYIRFIRDYDQVLYLSDEDFDKELESLDHQALEQNKFEAKRKAKEAEEKKQREAEAEKLRKEKEHIEAEKQAQAQKTFEIRCNRLGEVGFVENHTGAFVNDSHKVQLESLVDDVYAMDMEEFEDFIQDAKTELVNAKAEAERKAQEEAELKEKREAEEKAKKEAEAKRQKELQPDKSKAESFINALGFSEEIPTIKDKAIEDLLRNFANEAKDLQLSYIDALNQIK
ncbi:hypothetical protein [Psychroflexus aestuariivivens]|uniref:hypothetical protein n=1 Tax=Psychroflexus aestuariivivens TaxID=1795040 RepID=UPI000FD8C3C2|nr:hypothetical protein [Psychroflexus aestuariivivens]